VRESLSLIGGKPGVGCCTGLRLCKPNPPTGGEGLAQSVWYIAWSMELRV